MINPVIAEVTRGGIVESRHRGAFAVVDQAGKVVQSAGGIDAAVTRFASQASPNLLILDTLMQGQQMLHEACLPDQCPKLSGSGLRFSRKDADNSWDSSLSR